MKVLTKALAPVKKFGAKAVFCTKKHSPEILLGVGIIGFAGTVVVACKATLKADEVLDKYAENKSKIEEAKAEVASGEVEGLVYSEEDAKRDQMIATKDLIFGMAKLYAPAVGLGLLSIGCILTSYKIINGRFVGLMGAYTALDDSFKKYRKRVIDAVGPEKELELRTGVSKKKGYVTEVNDVGEKEVNEKQVDQRDPEVLEDSEVGDFVIFSDLTSTEYQKHGDPLYNESFLRAQEAYWNNVLFARGWVLESEVRRSLGLKQSKDDKSLLRGWILDPADTGSHAPLSFGIRGPIFRETGDHVLKTGRIVKELSGKEYLLEFNTDGVIWNLVHLWEH